MFDWKEEYSVGIEKIDKQHKKLLAIGRDLLYVFDNTTAGIDQYDQIVALLKELHDYTVYHFNFEEELMKKYDYIGLGSHQFQHKIFIKKLEDIKLDEMDLDQNSSTMDLLNFVAKWIENHILNEDQKYAPHLQVE